MLLRISNNNPNNKLTFEWRENDKIWSGVEHNNGSANYADKNTNSTARTWYVPHNQGHTDLTVNITTNGLPSSAKAVVLEVSHGMEDRYPLKQDLDYQ